MPWCARDTSPGMGIWPPPIKPRSEIVWCGARNGRVVTQAVAQAEQLVEAREAGTDHQHVAFGGLEGPVARDIHRHICHSVPILVSCPGGAPDSRCPPVCRPYQRQHLPIFPGMAVLEPAVSWIEDT